MLAELSELMKEGPIARTVVVLLSVLVGYLIARMSTSAVERGLHDRLDIHQVMLAKRLVFYGIMILSTLTGLNEAGINLSVIVGAAGVASVAIGFASQTTMSNLVSGIFMLLERPFFVGDIIKVGGTTGEVSGMGLFSTLLRTPENTMVRIPNETLMKSEITNMTRYPLRRVEVNVSVPYTCDIGQVRKQIVSGLLDLELTKKHPEPSVIFKSFGENAILMTADFWVDKEKVIEVSNQAAQVIKQVVESKEVGHPFPHRVISVAPQSTSIQ